MLRFHDAITLLILGSAAAGVVFGQPPAPDAPRARATPADTAFTRGPAEGAAPVPAEEDRALTLEQAVAVALQHNPTLLAAGHARSGASEGVEQARARFGPRVDVAGAASRTDNPTMVFSNLLGQERFGPANFAIASLNQPDPLDNFNARLLVTQPIYTGGQLRSGLSASRHALEASRGQEIRVRQETIFQTIRAYQGTLLARHLREVAGAAHAAAASHLKLAEGLVESGVAVPSDAMRLRVRLAEIDELLIRAEAGEQVARAALEAIMGRSPEGSYEVVEPEGEPARPSGVEDATRQALASRGDLAAAREGEAAAGEWAHAARSGGLPQAGFMGAYEINRDAPLGSGGSNWTATVTVNVNLFDGWGTASRVRQAREEQARAGSLRAGLERMVALEVRQAHADLAGGLARREAARRAVEQAEEGLRIVRERYENGLATITDLLDQEAALTDARTRAVQADYDCRNGEAALLLAMGTLGDGPAASRPEGDSR